MASEEGTGGSRTTALADAPLLSDPSLEALQRILLSTDGTVVQILEAFFRDPIRLASHVQFLAPISPTDVDLEPTGEETVLRRKVLLQGTRTGRNYISADTTIVVDRLEPPLREDLLSTSEPIGRLLRAHRTETFREMLHMGRRRAESLAGEFGVDADDELLFRIYRILAGGRPIMLLAEHFPAANLTAPEPQDQGPVVNLPDTPADTQPRGTP